MKGKESKRILAVIGIAILMLLIVMTASMGACAKPAPTPAPPRVFELTISTTGPLHDMYNVVTTAWGKWLYKESGGRIKLSIIPDNQAARVDAHYEAVVKGLVDMGHQMLAFMPGRFPLNEVCLLSGNWDAWSARRGAMSAMSLWEKYPELVAEFKDVKPLFPMFNISYHYFTTKKPLRTLADLKGLMSIEIGPANAAILKALGGSPQKVAKEESYDAMAKGVVDGHGVGYTAVDLFYPDLLNYGMEIGLQDTLWVVPMNLNTWNSLPPDLQKLFEGENAWRIASVMGHAWDEFGQQAKKNVEARWAAKGLPKMTPLPDEVKAKLQEAVKPIHEEWVKTAAKIVGEAKARAILADWFAFGQQYKYTGLNHEAQKIFDEWNALPSYK